MYATRDQAAEWAPDNCPDNVIDLIAGDQEIDRLGLRGLASADAAEFRQAKWRLDRLMRERGDQSRRRGQLQGAAAVAALAALSASIAWFIA